jgi:hypothetical protein
MDRYVSEQQVGNAYRISFTREGSEAIAAAAGYAGDPSVPAPRRPRTLPSQRSIRQVASRGDAAPLQPLPTVTARPAVASRRITSIPSRPPQPRPQPRPTAGVRPSVAPLASAQSSRNIAARPARRFARSDVVPLPMPDADLYDDFRRSQLADEAKRVYAAHRNPSGEDCLLAQARTRCRCTHHFSDHVRMPYEPPGPMSCRCDCDCAEFSFPTAGVCPKCAVPFSEHTTARESTRERIAAGRRIDPMVAELVSRSDAPQPGEAPRKSGFVSLADWDAAVRPLR